MTREEQLNKLHKAAREQKETIIKEIGAVDFHFQIPNFENPLMMIPAILAEISEFASGMEEFHGKKISDADSAFAGIKHASYAGMWQIWNSWNSVIGMVLTNKDPVTMAAFHDMMKDFAEEQMMKSKKKGN